jgi:hypothetical protein
MSSLACSLLWHVLSLLSPLPCHVAVTSTGLVLGRPSGALGTWRPEALGSALGQGTWEVGLKGVCFLAISRAPSILDVL